MMADLRKAERWEKPQYYSQAKTSTFNPNETEFSTGLPGHLLGGVSILLLLGGRD